MGSGPPPPSAVLLVSTLPLKGADPEQDYSLLYSLSLEGNDASAAVNVYKGLILAVRGALNSLCGQEARTIRLGHPSGTGVVLAFAHLQTCMLVLALSGSLSDEQACQLVRNLAQTLVLTAGHPDSWLHQNTSEGAQSPVIMKDAVKGLLDSLCTGVLSQLEGTGWRLALPSLALKDAVPQASLRPAQQHTLADLLEAYQEGSPQVASFLGGMVPMPQGFSFYQRRCCLMFRGQVIWSGLPAAHTKQLWQLCWSLQLFGQQSLQKHHHHHQQPTPPKRQSAEGSMHHQQEGPPPLQVTAHPLHMDAAASTFHDSPTPLHHTPQHSLLVLTNVNASGGVSSISSRFRASSSRGRAGTGSADGTDMGHQQAMRLSTDGGTAAAGQGVEAELASGAWDGLVLAVVLEACESMDRVADRAAGRAEARAAATLLSCVCGTPTLAQALHSSAADVSVLCPPSASATDVPNEPTVLLHDSLQGSLCAHNQGSMNSIDADTWHAISACSKLLCRGDAKAEGGASAVRRCRPGLTLGQIDHLSVSRTPKEAGQKLGSADPEPWMQHPELECLQGVQQAVVRVKSREAHGQPPFKRSDSRLLARRKREGRGSEAQCVTGALSADGRFVAFVVHKDDTDATKTARSALLRVSDHGCS